MALDLQGPLDDFRRRTQQLRLTMVAVESAAQSPAVLMTVRPGITLSAIGPETRNTTNAMSLVLLASSFEEFVREEVGQCADLLMVKYGALTVPIQHRIRSRYWEVLLSRLSMSSNIMTKTKPKTPDPALITKVRALIDTGRGFVMDGNATLLDRENFYHSRSNFRPAIVNEILSRVGIDDVIASAAATTKIKNYFGVTKKADAAERLVAKLEEFYSLRNTIVHSLSGVTGVGVDAALDYIEIMELTAEGIAGALTQQTGTW
ncbi:HEPN domain-containing protein [Brevundimonas bullata]|uniref:HEPN domain-containing protein n=1 Tax=Brevundimonas bullata TaxID=13160 RepID=UPI002FDB54BC